MNKKILSYLISFSLLSVSVSAFAGNKFDGNDKALQHRDNYIIKKYSDSTYRFKKVSDFGQFKIIKDQEYILTPKEVPEYTKYLNTPITVGQNVRNVPTENSLSKISEKLDRSRLQSVIFNVDQPSYLNIKYTYNDALAKQKLKNIDKFEYVDYRDKRGKQVIQHIYGLNLVKNKSIQVLSKGYKNPIQSFFNNGTLDKTRYIDELQRELDNSYPDIFKIETVENYSY